MVRTARFWRALTTVAVATAATTVAAPAALAAPADPSDAVETVEVMDADELHAQGITGDGIRVAVFDTGVDASHPDLAGAVVRELCIDSPARRFCPDDATVLRDDAEARIVEGPGVAADGHGHGTGASGIITGDGGVADIGVAPDAEIVAVKVFEDYCDADDCLYAMQPILAGVEHLADHPELDVDVVSMSLGLVFPYPFRPDCDLTMPALRDGAAAVATLRQSGTLVVASSGNDSHRTYVGAPSCLSQVVSVGASWEDSAGEHVWDRSNLGKGLDVVAPYFTEHAWPGGGVERMRGTSAAAPAAAGCAALLSALPSAPTPGDIATELVATGHPVAFEGTDYFRVDCAAAAAALGWTGGPGDPGEPVCVQAPNPDHVSAGRAVPYWIYAVAAGSGDNLGRNRSTVVTSLRQTGPGAWERVAAC